MILAVCYFSTDMYKAVVSIRNACNYWTLTRFYKPLSFVIFPAVYSRHRIYYHYCRIMFIIHIELNLSKVVKIILKWIFNFLDYKCR